MIPLLGAVEITVQRQNRYVAESGPMRGQVQTTQTDRTIRGSIQPLSGRDIEALPEGLRQTVRLKLYTAAKLKLANGEDQDLDIVVWQGEAYNVQADRDYSTAHALRHHAYYLTRRAPLPSKAGNVIS